MTDFPGRSMTSLKFGHSMIEAGALVESSLSPELGPKLLSCPGGDSIDSRTRAHWRSIDVLTFPVGVTGNVSMGIP